MDYLCWHKHFQGETMDCDSTVNFGHTVLPTCRASWSDLKHSWWSSWGTRSCRYLSGWCCKFSWDLDLRKEDCRHMDTLLDTGQLHCDTAKFPPLIVSSPACQQLIHQYAQRPVVCRYIMTLIEDDLWSHILRGSTESPSLLTDANFLGKTKVHLEKINLDEQISKFSVISH